MNKGQTWVIFSQEEIFSQHGNALEDSLRSSGFKTIYIPLPSGEDAKSLTSMKRAFSHILAAGCDRSSTFLAFGGALVGDVTGFLAARIWENALFIEVNDFASSPEGGGIYIVLNPLDRKLSSRAFPCCEKISSCEKITHVCPLFMGCNNSEKVLRSPFSTQIG
jgi:hypothetical protein